MTGLVEYESNKPTHFSYIRNGVKGNYDIVWHMIDIVRNTALLDKGFEDFVKQTTIDNGFDGYSDTDKVFEFWFDKVKELVDYIPDNQGVTESIKDARTTLQDGYGDCDDQAILNASILTALGYSPCFVMGGYVGGETFEHIYTVVYVNDKRYVFDTTLPDGHLNGEAIDLIKQEICIFEERPETDGLPSTIRNVKSLVNETKHNVQKTLPFLSGFLPFGFFGNQIAKTMFSGLAKDEPQSLNQVGSDISSYITDIIIKLQNGLIPKETAAILARKKYSQLFSLNQNELDQDTFNRIKKKIENKINYIDNFMPYGSTTTSNFIEVDIGKYIVIGVLGIGIYYFIKHSKI